MRIDCKNCGATFKLNDDTRRLFARLALPWPRFCVACRSVIELALREAELLARVERARPAAAATHAPTEAGIAPANSPAKPVGVVARLRRVFTPAADA